MVNTQTLRPAALAPRTRPVLVMVAAAHQVAIILTAILAGAGMATWLVELSLGSSTGSWIDYHQATTAAYTRLLPPIGALGLIAALAALAASWRNTHSRRLILAASGCLLIGLIVTVVVHFPINNKIATWQPATPPADWQSLRDQWLAAHAIRGSLVVAALALLAVASPRGRRTAQGA